ncbi:MAG: STAS domain-containing protein [Moraxellaceae bacterium]|nr:MAG: STAS domain-containing protein [Moraxellaceae bacterium]
MVAQLKVQDQVLFVTGSIGFDNAPAIYKQGLNLLQQQNQWPIALDLSGLTSSNTIALAVFVQWLRQRKVGQGFYLKEVPQKMQAIIKASNLADALY